MNVLITGANGFIGQALCKRLMAEGYHVRGAVRSTAQIAALPSGVEGTMVGNIGPETDWSDVLSGIEGIVHLAARVHVIPENAADPLAASRLVNVAGTERLARQAAEAEVKRLVYISSVKVNGERTGGSGNRPGVRSQEKTDRGRPSEIEKKKAFHGVKKSEGRGREGELKKFFSEEDVPEPRDPYAVSKWEAEKVLHEIVDMTGLEVVVLRPPLVYGLGVKANFLRLLDIVGRGIPFPLASVKNRRSLIYLGNLVDAIVTCISHPIAAGNTYLVSDGEDVSTPELIRRMGYALGRPVRLFPFPPFMLKMTGIVTGKSIAIDKLLRSLMVDSSKILRDLDWKAPFSMEQGLRETAEWYLKKDF
jgi:nucleoside-diphosphate-sugar epimerase